MLMLSGVTCAVCVAMMIVVLVQGPRKVVRFTPPPFDEAAVEGMPALTEADGYRPIDAQVYQFALCGELILHDGRTDIWLTNDAANDVWLKAVIRDAKGNELGETGLICPGEYVQSVQLTVSPEVTTDVEIVVMSYEPETYYSMGNVSLYTTLVVHGPETDKIVD